MIIKIIMISASFLLMAPSFINCSEMQEEVKQKKELSNYEKILAKFPNIQQALEFHGLTEKIINDSKCLAISSDLVNFRKYENRNFKLIIIKMDPSNKLGYKVTIRASRVYSAAAD